MAIAENIYERVNKLNPKALECIREFSKKTDGVVGLIVTEDMTREEKIMQGISYYIQEEGLSFEEAKISAISTINEMEKIMQEIRARKDHEKCVKNI